MPRRIINSHPQRPYAYLQGGRAEHTHLESDITDLGTYALAGHTHGLNDLNDVVITSVQFGDYFRVDPITAKYVNIPVSTVVAELIAEGGLVPSDGNVGFYGSAPSSKKTVNGSAGGIAALENLLIQLAGYGLITDNST